MFMQCCNSGPRHKSNVISRANRPTIMMYSKTDKAFLALCIELEEIRTVGCYLDVNQVSFNSASWVINLL